MNSAGQEPEPRPSSNLPSEASDSVTACLASTAGWRNASQSTKWPIRSRSVLAATQVATLIASQMFSSGNPGASRWSMNATPVNPLASAWRDRSTMSATDTLTCSRNRYHSAIANLHTDHPARRRGD